MQKSVSDPSQVAKAGKEAKEQRELELDDLRRVLLTDFGRRVIWRIFSFCGIFKISFTGNSETFFNEGQRNVGLKLRTDVFEARPEALLQMEVEAAKLDPSREPDKIKKPEENSNA